MTIEEKGTASVIDKGLTLDYRRDRQSFSDRKNSLTRD